MMVVVNKHLTMMVTDDETLNSNTQAQTKEKPITN